MAEASDILEVQDLLPNDSDWGEDKITTYLDGGRTVPEVLLAFWRGRASKYSTMLDVSESGSSRSLSQLYQNAKSMIDYWQGVLDKDEADALVDDRPAAVHQLKRV